MNLIELGWDDGWAEAFAPHQAKGHLPGRIAVRHKGQYDVLTEEGHVVGRIKGYLRHTAESLAELPVVGDWVALSRREHDPIFRIQEVLPRRTRLSRKVAGVRTREQMLAANVTTVFIVMGLTEDYNLRRLERYLVLVEECGARPVVVLNKADLVNEERLEAEGMEAKSAAPDAPIHVTSATEGRGILDLRQYLGQGETAIFVGSSGAGKSTIINRLIGSEHQRVAEVREADGRGRHTTTQREMILFPEGGVLIDSPGLREVQLWVTEDMGLDEVFPEIVELAEQCQFRNCDHESEPGCAVRLAIEEGRLDPARLHSYRQLRDELENVAKRQAQITEMRREIRKTGGKRRR
ncbi:ribosome small subunit-dependent GTPase A [bacterium]|nr:ribosome small subunit-dependent GTPase A [bacterium]